MLTLTDEDDPVLPVCHYSVTAVLPALRTLCVESQRYYTDVVGHPMTMPNTSINARMEIKMMKEMAATRHTRTMNSSTRDIGMGLPYCGGIIIPACDVIIEAYEWTLALSAAYAQRHAILWLEECYLVHWSPPLEVSY